MGECIFALIKALTSKDWTEKEDGCLHVSWTCSLDICQGLCAIVDVRGNVIKVFVCGVGVVIELRLLVGLIDPYLPWCLHVNLYRHAAEVL